MPCWEAYLAIPRLGKLAGTMSMSSREKGCVPRTECAAERQGGISHSRASWQAPSRHSGANTRWGMIFWVAAEAFWNRQGYSTWLQVSAYLRQHIRRDVDNFEKTVVQTGLLAKVVHFNYWLVCFWITVKKTDQNIYRCAWSNFNLSYMKAKRPCFRINGSGVGWGGGKI